MKKIALLILILLSHLTFSQVKNNNEIPLNQETHHVYSKEQYEKLENEVESLKKLVAEFNLKTSELEKIKNELKNKMEVTQKDIEDITLAHKEQIKTMDKNYIVINKIALILEGVLYIITFIFVVYLIKKNKQYRLDKKKVDELESKTENYMKEKEVEKGSFEKEVDRKVKEKLDELDEKITIENLLRKIGIASIKNSGQEKVIEFKKIEKDLKDVVSKIKNEENMKSLEKIIYELYSNIAYNSEIPSEAIQYYNRILKINSKDKMSYYRRGNLKYKSGDFEGAIADCEECLKLDPDYENAQILRKNAIIKKNL